MREFQRVRTLLAGGLLLAASAFLPSCQGFPKASAVFDDRTESRGPNLLAEVQPADIALLPVRNQTQVEDMPAEALRLALHDRLVDRLYSPLDLAFVDGHWVESSFQGDSPPDAVLVVAVNHYDTSDLVGQGILEVGAELRLFEGGSTGGRALWSAQVDRKVQVITGNPPFGPLGDLVAKGIEDYARLVVEAIPERDPLAADR